MQNAYSPKPSDSYLHLKFSFTVLFYISFSALNVLCMSGVILHELSVCSPDKGNVPINPIKTKRICFI
jgi:hypothetical protein